MNKTVLNPTIASASLCISICDIMRPFSCESLCLLAQHQHSQQTDTVGALIGKSTGRHQLTENAKVLSITWQCLPSTAFNMDLHADCVRIVTSQFHYYTCLTS